MVKILVNFVGVPTSDSRESRSVHAISPVESFRSTCASLAANVLESPNLYYHMCSKHETRKCRMVWLAS